MVSVTMNGLCGALTDGAQVIDDSPGTSDPLPDRRTARHARPLPQDIADEVGTVGRGAEDFDICNAPMVR